jgi:hypothetical protein
MTVADCLYCRTQNAININWPMVASREQAVRAKQLSIDEAVATDRIERAETRTELVRELRRYLVHLGILFGLLAVLVWDQERPDVRSGSEFPVYGVAAAFGVVALVIVLAVKSNLKADEEARSRRKASGADAAWGCLGPILFYVFLYALVRLAMFLFP